MTLHDSTVRFQGRVIKVTTDDVTLPNGHRATLEIIHHPGGAAVVALDDQKRICLLRQFRHAVGGYLSTMRNAFASCACFVMRSVVISGSCQQENSSPASRR
jgi:hypothetical protein